MSSFKQTFTVTVHSPLGKQAIGQFEHFLNKVSQDAKSRWGIEITIERHNDEETPDNGGFDE